MRTRTGLLVAAFITAIAVVVVLTVSVSKAFLDRQPGQAAHSCSGTGHSNHQVVIRDDTVMPSHTVGHLCDTLTIVNQDDSERLMAFGAHEHHTPYDGITERALGQGQSFAVTLVQIGNFRFHDHAHDEVQGTFTVEN